MTRAELLEKAIGLQQANKLDEARRIYQAVLEESPDCGDALHFLGVLCFQEGRAEQAIELVRRAIAALPDYADAHNNLGNMYLRTDQLEAARTCYERALKLEPQRLETHNNLGVLLRHLGDLQRSAAHLRKAIELAPQWADAHYNFANTLLALHEHEQAATHYRAAIQNDSKANEAFRRLGTLLYATHRLDEAVAVYDRWLALEPGNPVALHMRAAVSGEGAPARASDDFLRETFDRFAASFDSQLERLQYRAPQLLGAEIEARLGSPQGTLCVLDAGCGTGLCGPLLKPYAARLIGVDLSERMLAQARTRDCYDELTCMNLVDCIGRYVESLDVVTSADTLVYFGALDSVLRNVARALKPGGWLLFTLERPDTEPANSGYALGPHGRYAHGRTYVASALRDAGLRLLAIQGHVLRKELGQPVNGWLVTAARPS